MGFLLLPSTLYSTPFFHSSFNFSSSLFLSSFSSPSLHPAPLPAPLSTLPLKAVSPEGFSAESEVVPCHWYNQLS